MNGTVLAGTNNIFEVECEDGVVRSCAIKGKVLKILYTTQAKVQPPTFVLFTNNGDLLKDHYKRYIENKLREAFGFFGTPIIYE